MFGTKSVDIVKFKLYHTIIALYYVRYKTLAHYKTLYYADGNSKRDCVSSASLGR